MIGCMYGYVFDMGCVFVCQWVLESPDRRWVVGTMVVVVLMMVLPRVRVTSLYVLY